MSASDKLLINVALTGMIPQKKDNPSVPVTPREIADDIRRCRDLGAAIMHIHARDEDGWPTYRIGVYREIIHEMRQLGIRDVIVCVTTSGRVHNTFESRSEVLDLDGDAKPEMASLTLGSMNFPNQASVNTPEMIRSLAKRMSDRSVVPELEVFEMGMIDYSKYLIDKAVLTGPFYYNILLGSLGTMQASPLNLAVMVNSLPTHATWAAAGIGRYQFPMNSLAVTMGGHVRVGLEDALFMDGARLDPASNPKLVERVVTLARSAGREPATPDEARQIIGLGDRVLARANS